MFSENIIKTFMKKSEKIEKIIRDLRNQPNKELIYALDYLNNDFEATKKTIIELTKRLDSLELTYNKVLEEFEKRKNTNVPRQ